MTKIFFVRHAEPNYENHDDRIRELSPRGMEDRKKVTAFLADKNIDIVISRETVILKELIPNWWGHERFAEAKRG